MTNDEKFDKLLDDMIGAQQAMMAKLDEINENLTRLGFARMPDERTPHGYILPGPDTQNALTNALTNAQKNDLIAKRRENITKYGPTKK